MLGRTKDNKFWRRGFVILALIALLIKVIVPPGFMVGSHHGQSLQICTGHEAPSNGDDGSQDKSAKHDAPCAFAGHALSFSPPIFDGIPFVQIIAYVLKSSAARQDLVPGRGLAAPPPPAHAPPEI